MNAEIKQIFQCQSLEEANDKSSDFMAELKKLEKKRQIIFEQLKRDLPGDPADLAHFVCCCEEIINDPLRLVLRGTEEKEVAQAQIIEADTVVQGSNAYSKALISSLLYNKASAHSHIRFDLILPCFQKVIGSAVCDFIPQILESDVGITKIFNFYKNLFISMAGEESKKWPSVRQYLMDKLVPDFSTLPFLSSRLSLRTLRAAHNALVNEHLCDYAEYLGTTSVKADRKSCRIGFLTGGNTHGHGWPSIKRIVERFDGKKIIPVLITWKKNKSIPDVPIETFVINNWDTAVQEIRELNLDLIFFATSFDRNMSEKYMELGRHRLARTHATAFFNNTTTCLIHMDAVITSSSMDDSNAANRLFSEEEIIFIKNLPFGFDFKNYFPVEIEHFTKRDFGLPDDCKIITCGNSFTVKAREEYLDFIASILSKVQNCYFIMMPDIVNKHEMYSKLCDVFSAAGIDKKRILIVEPSSRSRQYGILKLADLYIDFFPFSGANSLFDPIWTQTPVLTLQSEHVMRCRQGAAILEDLGLQDLVAGDLANLENKALKLLSSDNQDIKRRLGPECLALCSAFNGKSAQEIADVLTQLAFKEMQ